MLNQYRFENKHHLLEDFDHHQLPKINQRISALQEFRKGILSDSIDAEKFDLLLHSIMEQRSAFLLRADEIRACQFHEWDEVKKRGKQVNDSLLSTLAEAERQLGLPVGEG